ncbi:TonB-dependent receptor [candidate division KSB1 bacterium]|nr:TonB-dependent receptor [candidate division KSB1 bacterium]
MNQIQNTILVILGLFLLSPDLGLTQATIQVSGQVTDASSGAPLMGANIFLESTKVGTTSDQSGHFRINVLAGTYVISASFIGYEIGKQKFEARQEPIELNFKLRPLILTGQEVIISATRAKERETPVAVVNLSHQELRQRYWAQDIPMLLAEVPGIYAYSDAGNGLGYTYLKIRGFDQKRVSVMINGIPLNDPEDHQVYWVDLPDVLASVHDIQIQRGVGSSLYGSAAFGGTVNVLTSEMSLPREMRVATGFGSDATQKYSFRLHSGLIENQYIFSARFSKILSAGYRENSAIDMWSYYLSATRYGLNSLTTINIYGGQELTHAAWEASPQSEIKKNHRHNPITYPNTVDNFQQPHYELLHHWKLSESLSLNNSLYYIHGKGYYEAFKTHASLFDYGLQPFYLMDSTRVQHSDIVRQKWVAKDQLGWILRLDGEHAHGTFNLGMNGYLFNSDHWGQVVWVAQLPPGAAPENKYYQYQGQKKMLTLFAHELYRLTPTLSLMAAVDWQLQSYQFHQKAAGNFLGINRHAYTIAYNFLNPRIGANYNLSDRWNLFGNISVAHREPTDDDLFDVWQGPDDLGVHPLFAQADTIHAADGGIDYLKWRDPLTQPEQLLDYELGLGYQSDRLQLKLNGYWMNFRNEIVPYSQVDADGFPIKGNAENTVHRGLEGSCGVKLSKALELSTAVAICQNYFARFTMYEAQYDADWNFIGTRRINYRHKTISGFPGTMANVKLKYLQGACTSYLFLQHIGRQYLDHNELRERSIPAYTVLNFQIAYEVTGLPGINGIRLSLWVNNLLDKTYETAGYYDSWSGENYVWPAAKRNFFLGLETNL